MASRRPRTDMACRRLRTDMASRRPRTDMACRRLRTATPPPPQRLRRRHFSWRAPDRARGRKWSGKNAETCQHAIIAFLRTASSPSGANGTMPEDAPACAFVIGHLPSRTTSVDDLAAGFRKTPSRASKESVDGSPRRMRCSAPGLSGACAIPARGTVTVKWRRKRLMEGAPWKGHCARSSRVARAMSSTAR